MRPILPVAASLLVVPLVPGPAVAQHHRGTTKEQRRGSVRTADTGVPTLVRITWKARCRRPGATFTDRTDFRTPLDQATADAVQDTGPYTVRDGAWRYRISAGLTGGRSLTDPANPATEQRAGTVKATIVVRRNGRRVDTCTLRTTSWVARVVAG